MEPTIPEHTAEGRASGPTTPEPGNVAALSDDQLVERYRRARTADVCTLIAARHAQMVFRTCFRRLGNVHDAEDATQAVLLAFVQRPDRVKGPLGAWLHEVARQTVHNLLRSRTRQRRREEATVRANPPAATPSTTDLGEELDAALSRLPARLREAVIARYLEGQKVADAARIAGCDPGTFGRRCDQGLDRLRTILARRGTAIAPTALIGFMAQEATAAVPAAALGAIQVATTGTASAKAALLSKQVLSAMFWAKAKLAAAAVAVATAGAGAVVVPLAVSTTPTTHTAKQAEPQVLLRLDFEDGLLPTICTAGKVVKGPDRPGNRFCLEGDRTILFEKKEGLCAYSDDLCLVFDLWLDARATTLDIHFWNGTQRASFGFEPQRLPRKQWVEGVVLRFADSRFGTAAPKPGDLISNLAIQAGQPDAKIYVDNLELVRAADPRSLAREPKK